MRLQDTIGEAVDRSKYNRIDLGNLTFIDVLLSTEDSLVDIIPIYWDDTGSDDVE